MKTVNASVFMVTNSNLKNGIPNVFTFVNSQARSIKKTGWKIFMGVVDDRTSIKGIVRNIRKLRSEVALESPGLIHAQYGSMTAAISYFIRGKLPLVVSFCGDDLLGTPAPGLGWRWRSRAGRFIGLWAARGANAIIVKSYNLFQALPDNLKTKAIILPNGVDVGFFRPIDQCEARAKLNWPQKGKIVLFNSSHGEDQIRKNLTLARKTIETLSQTISNVSLYFLSKVTSEEVMLMLNAADCLLVTSLHEGSPNIVKEAMSCNLPVVSVPCGDVAQRLSKTNPGYIEPYDPQALSVAIQKVVLAGVRSNGREQLISQGLTVENVAGRLIQIYENVQKDNMRL
ncbi:MAG TPA: glycosyltransferase [Nitrospirales bacterium]|nr:hypothetical protein [Nitrospiraceae bacterium]HNP28709.1 glycosyltransferase [Nitrospirales bacterium]